MQSSISNLMFDIGYEFKDSELLNLALCHRSYDKSSNERLEFLGDSVLNFIITSKIYEQCPELKEGSMTRLRSNLISELTLVKIAQDIHLAEYMLVGKGEKATSSIAMLADALEALIGAIFLDGGLHAACEAICKLYDACFRQLHLYADKDAKSLLQELLQAKKLPQPVYNLTKVSGLAHNQTFYISCEIKGLDIRGYGVGLKRKTAEQLAARDLLDKLNPSPMINEADANHE